MDVTELQYGDFVQVVKIDGKPFRKDHLMPVTFDDIKNIEIGRLEVEPVYLTDDILHKVLCGCSVEIDPYRWRIGTNKKGVEFNFWDWTIIAKDWDKNKEWTYLCDCKYLHELQHAVKMFGLTNTLYYDRLLY